MEVQTNEFQTPVTEELLSQYPQEVQDQLLEFISTVPFIRGLISPNRQRAKDRPRDSKGRIIVDLANPHIVENIDYFRPAALHYQKYGCYTNLRPNANPQSEYGKWIREEIRRCWEGYVRPSDGEWVTGYMYWYLNYVPMMVTEVTEGTNRADRVEGFPDFWEGNYWLFHYLEQSRNGGLYDDFKGGKHSAILAKRGCGKSFTCAGIMSHNLVLGENEKAHKRVMTILTAYTKEYLAGKDGTLNKFTPIIDFVASNTQFPRRRLSDSNQDMSWQMGYIDKNTGTKKGSLNQVVGVSSKDDESKLRGKRGTIIFEEFGSFPRLINIYNIVRFGVEEGDYTFGQIILVGTSGDDASDFYGAQELIYNPNGHKIYSLPNNYDKPNQGRPQFAFFFPAYVNRKGCYNKDGVSDVIKALLQVLMARYEAKYKTSDPQTIVRVTADMPITPAEAMIRAGVNIFPTTDLAERQRQLDSNPSAYDDVYIGDVVIKDGKAEYKMTDEQPIRFFPHKNNKNMLGAIEFYALPEINKATGKVYENRYIGGVDPYDNDESCTNSLGSIFILDLWTDRVVAEYTGRPLFADDFYEKCRKLALFYNARLNYEQNKKGMFAYFSKMNSLYLLTDTLEFLKDRQMIKPGGYGNTLKGTTATLPINSFARSLTRKWLMEAIPTTVKNDMGEEVETTVPRLYTLKSKAFLQELQQWNTEGNFDRVSSFGMLMLLREDRLIMCQNDIKSLESESTSASYTGNDPFFTNNYKLSKFRSQ